MLENIATGIIVFEAATIAAAVAAPASSGLIQRAIHEIKVHRVVSGRRLQRRQGTPSSETFDLRFGYNERDTLLRSEAGDVLGELKKDVEGQLLIETVANKGV